MPHVHRKDADWWRRCDLRALRLGIYTQRVSAATPVRAPAVSGTKSLAGPYIRAGDSSTSQPPSCASCSTATPPVEHGDPLLSSDPWAGKHVNTPSTVAPFARRADDPWAFWKAARSCGADGAPKHIPSGSAGPAAQPQGQTTVLLAASDHSFTPPSSGRVSARQQQPSGIAASSGVVSMDQIMAVVGSPAAVADFARQIGFGVAFFPLPAQTGPCASAQTGIPMTIPPHSPSPAAPMNNNTDAAHFDIAAEDIPMDFPSYEDGQDSGTCSSTEPLFCPPISRDF